MLKDLTVFWRIHEVNSDHSRGSPVPDSIAVGSCNQYSNLVICVLACRKRYLGGNLGATWSPGH